MFSFKLGGVNRFRVGAAGRVGIGNDAIDITGTALDQLVVGNGTSSQGVVVYHGTNGDGGYAFAGPSGALTGRILYKNSGDYLSLQHGGSDNVNIYSNLVDITTSTEIDGRLFFGDFTNQETGRIQIKHEGPNEGITLWTESGNITKRIWIDDATNTMQLTAGNTINKGISLDENGHIGIGADPGTNKLEVNGTIRSKEVIVEATNWPDYVFEEDYDLTSLKELEAYIKANKHLPEIPSAKEMEANGIILGEMNMLLLKKIEELTLHAISQGKHIQILMGQNKELAERLKNIESNQK